ncbi:hypothetical protein XENTR_v10007553 [Xenopus tropicalis]|nr:hypothetical protein XENTR_v10007553 [Xenopus tropicalis]
MGKRAAQEQEVQRIRALYLGKYWGEIGFTYPGGGSCLTMGKRAAQEQEVQRIRALYLGKYWGEIGLTYPGGFLPDHGKESSPGAGSTENQSSVPG